MDLFFHVDIDAFFASVEQALDPSLRGRPVVVGNGVIASCSYETRKYGLHAGMSLITAERLCPRAVVIDGDSTTYMRYSQRIEKICRQYAPVTERVSIDELYCNMSGCELVYPDIFGCAMELALAIEHQTGIAVSIGIAENRLIAKTASSFGKPRGITLIFRGQGAGFIAPMHISELRGIGRKKQALLQKMNIKTIQQLRLVPRRSLRRMFGVCGDYIADTCRGIEAGFPPPRSLPASVSRETTFRIDTSDMTYITGMLWYLIERAAVRLRSLNLECRRVELHIRYSDYKDARRSGLLTGFSNRDPEIFRVMETMLHRLYTRRVTLRLVGIKLSNFRKVSADTQLLLFEPEPPPSHLYESVDRIREKHGHAALAGGRSIHLMNKLPRNRSRGFTLRTPSLTQ